MIFFVVKDIVEIKFIIISLVHTDLLSCLSHNTSSLNILKLMKNMMRFTEKKKKINPFLSIYSLFIWESLLFKHIKKIIFLKALA